MSETCIFMGFKEDWSKAVAIKNSTLCAGLDPAEYAMGRSDKGEGLPPGENKKDWALKYIEAVAPFCAAIKPNMRYWGRFNDLSSITEIVEFAQDKGLVVIQDSKEADIGPTNDAGIFYAAIRGADAVTIAPYAGNMDEAAKQGEDRGIGLITMCLMSNPGYAKIKNSWFDVSDSASDYDPKHIKEIDGIPHIRKYMQLANDARKFGVDGIVVGAPSSKNHLKEEEIENACRYFGRNGLVLVPGIGAQGGEVTSLSKYFNAKNLIANVGRALMFPNGAYSTPEQQAEAAKQYRDMLNNLRAA